MHENEIYRELGKRYDRGQVLENINKYIKVLDSRPDAKIVARLEVMARVLKSQVGFLDCEKEKYQVLRECKKELDEERDFSESD